MHAGQQTFHVSNLALPRLDVRNASRQYDQIVSLPQGLKKLDVIDWKGDDEKAIIKRGQMMSNFKDTLKILAAHVKRMGLGQIFTMWEQIAVDNFVDPVITCFRDGDNTNLLTLVDYKRKRKEQVMLW